jgi:hypothetical protein
MQVHTSYFANYFHPVPAARATVLDTSALDGAHRARLGAHNFDNRGRLAANRRIALDLRGLVDTRQFPTTAAVALQVMTSSSVASGRVVVHDGKKGQGVDVLSYAVLPAAITANRHPYSLPGNGAAIVGLDPDDTLWVSVTQSTHLRLTVTGLIVPDPAAVVTSPKDPPATGRQKRTAQQYAALRAMSPKPAPSK